MERPGERDVYLCVFSYKLKRVCHYFQPHAMPAIERERAREGRVATLDDCSWAVWQHFDRTVSQLAFFRQGVAKFNRTFIAQHLAGNLL